jgi:hypothetical protein
VELTKLKVEPADDHLSHPGRNKKLQNVPAQDSQTSYVQEKGMAILYCKYLP